MVLTKLPIMTGIEERTYTSWHSAEKIHSRHTLHHAGLHIFLFLFIPKIAIWIAPSTNCSFTFVLRSLFWIPIDSFVFVFYLYFQICGWCSTEFDIFSVKLYRGCHCKGNLDVNFSIQEKHTDFYLLRGENSNFNSRQNFFNFVANFQNPGSVASGIEVWRGMVKYFCTSLTCIN